MADTCEHWTSETGYAKASLYAACPWCEIERQKQELSLAEEWLANYAQELEQLRAALRYWLPDETMVPKGHESAWNEHVQLIPEDRSSEPQSEPQTDIA